MIEYLNGHWRSKRTPKESAGLLEKDVETLTAEEREAVQQIVAEWAGQVPEGLLQTLGHLEWVRAPVDMQTFCMDPYYLGNTCDNLYPILMEDLTTLFSEGYREAIFTGAIGYGKCLKSDAFFVDQRTGRRLTMGEAAGFSGPVYVASLHESGEVRPQKVSRVWKSGRKACVRLVLWSGQELGASKDHPVLTPAGYRPVAKLAPGDLVAVARSVPEPENGPTLSDAEVSVVGALIADGGMRGGSVTYTKVPEMCEQVEALCREVPGFEGVGYTCEPSKARTVVLKGLVPWVRRRELWGKLSKHRRVPADLFGLRNEQLAVLLRWIYTDGNVYLGSPRTIELCFASEGLIDDVQYLLRRFGVVARKYYKRVRNQEGEFDAWQLSISDAPTQLRFMRAVGPIPGKEVACAELVERAEATVSNPNWDIVPVGYDELKEVRAETGPHEKKWWAKVVGLRKGSWMGREKFLRLCEAVGYRGKYYKLAAADVVWEKVKVVEDDGVHDVYDLTVPGTQNAVVNGVVAHNTFAASIGICRLLYILSCMRDPHRSFGIAANSNISIICLSVNEILATKVAYENIATKIEASPYFQEHFPFEKTKKELRFPHKVWVAARASNDGSVLGLNVIGGLLDECLAPTTLISRIGAPPMEVQHLPESMDNILTFDSSGRTVKAQAHVKCSTRQMCYRIQTCNGKSIECSGNHPILCNLSTGLTYVDARSIVPGLEVVVYAEEGTEVVGRGQAEAFRSSEEEDGGQESVLRKEALERDPRKDSRISEAACGMAPLRRDEAEDVRCSEGQGVHRGASTEDLRDEEEKVGGRGLRGAARAHSGAGSAAGRRGEPVLWETAHYGDSGEDCAGTEGGSPLCRGPRKDVSISSVAASRDKRSLSHGEAVSDSEGGHFSPSGRVGVSSCRDPRRRPSGAGVRVRDACSALHDRAWTPVDSRGLPCTASERGDKGDRGEGSKHLESRPAADCGCGERMSVQRLGPRRLERELSVARVVSKVEVGVQPTYDISVPGYECFVADGIVVHNTNFMPKSTKGQDPRFNLQDRAEVLYNAMQRRMKSRFERKGKLPGILFVVSSKQTNDDFTAKRIKQSKQDPTVFVRDYCLSGDTVVPLLDGTAPTLAELAEKHGGTDATFEVYSFDVRAGRIVPGKASRPRLTMKQERVLEVGLDNGEVVRATAWHPFMLKSGEYKRAGELQPGDSLMPLYRRPGGNHKVVFVRDAGREDVYDLTVEGLENFAVGAGVFVHNSLWDVKPDTYLSGGWFHVVVGNEHAPSRVLNDGEDVEEVRKTLPEDCVVIEVPEDFRSDFEKDLEGAVRDLAGVATISVSPYIQRRTKIIDAIRPDMRHPFSVEVYDPSQPGLFYWHKMVRPAADAEGGNRPIVSPYAPRHVHIDPSLRGDATGFAMGHVAGYREVVRRDDEGQNYPERAPEIMVDVVLKIIPPMGGEIILGDVRKLVYQLARHGYMITCVSIDSWNSADAIQKLNQRGFNAVQLSVDRTMGPYDLLKTALYEDRLFYYDYPPLLKELRELEHDRVKRKVDHPLRGCFVGRTRVPLLDGTHPRMVELDGKTVWVYSARSDGTVVPGRARGRRTGVRTEFVDVVLDSGVVETCTPEHLWMLRDGTYKEARRLRPGVDRLMPISWKCSARKHKAFRNDIDQVALEKVKGDPEAVNANAAARILGCGRNVVMWVLRDMGLSSWEEFQQVETGENHKVRAVVPVRMAVPIPVYDLEVDDHSNFALCSGVFVHNSKDVSDALAGVVWTLTEHSSSMPLSIMRSIPEHGDAWMQEHMQAALARNYGSEDVSDMTEGSMLPPFLIGSGDGWGD